MRLALMAGVLTISLFTTFYQVGWLGVSGGTLDSTQAGSGEMKAMDGEFPPPPSFP